MVAQMVNNLPAIQETWVQSLGQKDPLEKGMATGSNILAGEFHGKKSLVDYLWLFVYCPYFTLFFLFYIFMFK